MTCPDERELCPEDPAWRDGDTSAIEMRQDRDITEAMRTLHNNGVTAWQYAEYLAARRSDELRSSGEEPF